MSGAIAAAAIGGGLGMMSAGKNAKSASNAMQSQERMQEQQLDFQKQQYQRYLNLYGPIEQQLAGQAHSSQPLFYDQNAAAIKQNYANAGRNLSSQMSMRGMAGSGQDAAAMGGLASQQAGALSGAYNTGMQNRLNLGMQLTNHSPLQSAGQGVSGSMQGMANLYGNQANLYNNASMMGGQAVGNASGGLGRAWGAQGINSPGQQGALQQNWNDMRVNPQQTVPVNWQRPNDYINTTSDGIDLNGSGPW